MAPHILERIPSVLNVGVMDFTRSVVAATAMFCISIGTLRDKAIPRRLGPWRDLPTTRAMAHCSVSISIGPTQKP